jgi:hypothetical protein
VEFILLRMANPTTMEAPYGRGALIGVRLWDVGWKIHCRSRELVGTEVVPSVVGSTLPKVTVRRTWLLGW